MSDSAASDRPWYHAGLAFTCTGCGNCCTGAPGYVWLTAEESQAIATHLGLDRDQFEAQYTRKVGARRTLLDVAERNWDCIFLDAERRCQIYPVRPNQCRTWPFWDSNLKTPATWQATCEICPGSGEGKVYALEHIDQQRAIVKM